MSEVPKPHQPLVTHIYTADPSAHVLKIESISIHLMIWIMTVR